MRIAISLLLLAHGLDAKHIIKVTPEDNFQAMLDGASPGDEFLLEPGIYVNQDLNTKYGFRVSTHDIKIIGKKSDGMPRIVYNSGSEQFVGLYAAPAGDGTNCEYDKKEGCPDILNDFYIKDVVVEGFPGNGIQTRWVDGFVYDSVESKDNRQNGLYLTISKNGKVKNSKSTGSYDSALWVAGSSGVTVEKCELAYSTTGFEVTVSENVVCRNNDIHDNTVGVGLYHPNMAGTDETFKGNWVVVDNQIYNNNLPNPSPPGSFSSSLPSGVGVLNIGISENQIKYNHIHSNDYVGISVGGLCTLEALVFGEDYQCFNATTGEPSNGYPINDDPAADFNLVYKNVFGNNGANPPPLAVPGSDINVAFLEVFDGFEHGQDNCFANNTSTDAGGELKVFSTYDGLPTGGCSKLLKKSKSSKRAKNSK